MGSVAHTKTKEKSGLPAAWKLEDAKARFSEVVRRAQSEGPQRVTVRGREAVVIISVAELDRLLPRDPSETAFVPFLEGLGLDHLSIERDFDWGGNIVL